MLENELIDLVEEICEQKTEKQNVELKTAHDGCPRKLYDTLSSFSNQDSGGIIIFGIEENNGYSLKGVYDLQDLQKKVTEQCNQMEPKVRAVFTSARIDGKNICSAEIPSVEISQRPCYYTGLGIIKGSYIRVGDADLPMTDYEVYSYEAFRKHVHDDERKVEKASLNMLDKNNVEKYVLDKKIGRPGFAKLEENQMLEMLNITREGKPTLAAVMNFGIYPQGYFPQLAITAIVVPGKEIGEIDSDNARFLDNKRIEGTIADMTDEALNFCKRNMKIKTVINPKTGKREDRTEYPIEAVREAVLNALIHRDYSEYTEGTPIQMNYFSDRLEIHSPGGLYGRMRLEQLGEAKADLRNPALAVIAETMTNAENRYSGIPTMRRLMKEYELPAPVFENRRQEFIVTFYNSTKENETEDNSQNLSDTERILEFCKTPRTRKEIADFLKIKTVSYAISENIRPLVKKGLIGLTIPESPRSRNQKYYTV